MTSPNSSGGAGDSLNKKLRDDLVDLIRSADPESLGFIEVGFHDYIRHQVQRLFQDYNPPLYARARGYNRERSLRAVEGVAANFLQPLGRQFTDVEMQAFGEHLLSSMNTMLACRWGFTGLAAFMTFRGRKTFRFPFFKPRTGGAFDPFTSNRPVQSMWHLARFGAYYSVGLFILYPMAEIYINMSWAISLKKEPRLAGLLRDTINMEAQKSANMKTDGAQPANPTDEQTPSWDAPDRNADESSATDKSVAAQAQAAWGAYRQAHPSPEAASPERSDKWDTFPDDLDDASPVAPSARDSRGDSVNQSSVSAWDRIRQQSQSQSQSQSRQNSPRPQQSWQAPQGVGAGDDNAAPSYRGPRDSYSFSSADEEKAVAKGQAQKEFDEMLDRERRGVEKEQGSWGRK